MTYKQVLENKIQGMQKKALLGKGLFTKHLTNLLKDTIKSPHRGAFIQGINGFAGEHEKTRLGRYII